MRPSSSIMLTAVNMMAKLGRELEKNMSGGTGMVNRTAIKNMTMACPKRTTGHPSHCVFRGRANRSTHLNNRTLPPKTTLCIPSGNGRSPMNRGNLGGKPKAKRTANTITTLPKTVLIPGKGTGVMKGTHKTIITR